MQASHPTPLSITRHTIQLIWQAALTNSKNETSGLLGRQSNKAIDTIAQSLDHQQQIHDLKLSAQTWNNDRTLLAGVYQCQKPDAISMQATEKLLEECFQAHTPFIHLYIRFDTDGVLESEAWVLNKKQAIQIPMQLTE